MIEHTTAPFFPRFRNALCVYLALTIIMIVTDTSFVYSQRPRKETQAIKTDKAYISIIDTSYDGCVWKKIKITRHDHIKNYGVSTNSLSIDTVKWLSARLFDKYKNELGVASEEFIFRDTSNVNDAIYVMYTQAIGNVPVHNTDVRYSIRKGGKLSTFDIKYFPGIHCVTEPRLSGEDAINIVKHDPRWKGANPSTPQLTILKKRENINLVWAVYPGVKYTTAVFVDAIDGNIVWVDSWVE